MSVVLVCFPGAPKISEEAVKKEEELDKYLETRVEGQHTHKSLRVVTSHITTSYLELTESFDTIFYTISSAIMYCSLVCRLIWLICITANLAFKHIEVYSGDKIS